MTWKRWKQENISPGSIHSALMEYSMDTLYLEYYHVAQTMHLSNTPRHSALFHRCANCASMKYSNDVISIGTRMILFQKAIEDYLLGNFFNVVRSNFLSKERAKEEIRRLFEHCKENKLKPVLYYTGHGEVGTGDWCFSNGTISIKEVLIIVGKQLSG